MSCEVFVFYCQFLFVRNDVYVVGAYKVGNCEEIMNGGGDLPWIVMSQHCGSS